MDTKFQVLIQVKTSEKKQGVSGDTQEGHQVGGLDLESSASRWYLKLRYKVSLSSTTQDEK